MKILEPQYGKHFVGRDYDIHESKKKIRANSITILTGERGIGKTNLMKILEFFFQSEQECHYINYGSLFSDEMSRIFLPEQITTGKSGSLGGFGFSGGAGKSWKPREHSILEYMEESKEKIIFVENAQELKKEEINIILTATDRNNKLKFILEIATPYMPDVKIRVSSDQIVELKNLSDESIKKIVLKECPTFLDSVIQRIIFLSQGIPYISRSLAYICDKKTTEDEMLEFLKTLKDDDIKYNLDRIHKEVLETLGKEGQDIIKKLALAPPKLTIKLIEAFCGEKIDTTLDDINERGILSFENDFHTIYHPLFRDYLRSKQPIALRNMNKIYFDAMEKIKSDFDSIYILFETLKEPEIFKELIELSENYTVLNSIGVQCYTLGRIDQAILPWSRILMKAKESEDKKWESIATGNMGNIYQIKGDLDKALGYFGKALKLFEEQGSKEGMGNSYANMGFVFLKGDLDKALEYFEKALKMVEGMGRKKMMANVYGGIGVVYQTRGDFNKALEYYGDALKQNEEQGSKVGIANEYGNMGNIYQIKGDLDKALGYYGKAFKLFEEQGSKVGIATAYGNMGNIYRIKGELDKALEYFEKALKLDEGMERKNGMANNFGNMGVVFQNKGDLDKALEYYRKALKLFEELGHKEGMAKEYQCMGVVYQTGDPDKALEYYGKALKLFEELGSKEGVAYIYGNTGTIYLIKGDLDKALEYHEMALKLFEELGSKEGVAKEYGNMGVVYKNRWEIDKALEYYGKALVLCEELGSKGGMAYQYGNMGIVYQNKGDLDKALECYENALGIFKEMKIGIEISRTLMNIGNILVSKNRKDSALDYYLESQEHAIDNPMLFKVINKKVNELLGII